MSTTRTDREAYLKAIRNGEFDGEEPSPKDRSLTRAERRRLQRGESENAMPGKLGCRFCRSTKGTYQKAGNRFFCFTKDCRGNR